MNSLGLCGEVTWISDEGIKEAGSGKVLDIRIKVPSTDKLYVSVPLSLWGDAAEKAMDTLAVGSSIIFQGKADENQYNDKSGKKVKELFGTTNNPADIISIASSQVGNFRLNQFSFTGNVTEDIILRKTGNGKSVTNFGIAIRGVKGDFSQSFFVDVTVWEKLAQACSDYLKKGSQSVTISGYLQADSWDDKDDPEKKNWKTIVVAKSVDFPPKK